jgi:hypothetical protein
MTLAVLFVVIGLLLVGLLLLSLLRSRAAERTQIESLETVETSPRLPVELPPRQLIERIFGPEDWNFVRDQQSPELQSMFLRQRRALALSWLDQIEASSASWMRTHRGVSRTSPEIETSVELRLVAEYLLFHCVCRLLGVAIWLHGPVAMINIVERVDAFLERLAARFEPEHAPVQSKSAVLSNLK